MKLLDAHPFRYVAERPSLGRFAKHGHPVLDGLRDDADFVDLYEPGMAEGLAKLVAGHMPSPADLPSDARSAYEDGEHMSAIAVRRFFAHGKHVITGTPELMADLAMTDLDKVRLDDVKLPFDNFYVALGDGHDWKLPGTDAVIDGLYVDVIPEEGRHLGILFTTKPQGDPGRRIRSPRQATPVMPFSLEYGDTIPDLVEEGIETSFTMMDEDSPRAMAIKAGRVTISAALNLAFNLVAYMTAEPGDVGDAWPDDAPLPKGRAPSRGVDAATRNALLDKGFVTVRLAGRDVTRLRAESPRPSSALSASYERRGHWRWQPHGTGSKLVKLIWILPTWIRPDLPAAGRNVLHVQAPAG